MLDKTLRDDIFQLLEAVCALTKGKWNKNHGNYSFLYVRCLGYEKFSFNYEHKCTFITEQDANKHA